jgi:hypothetical protein
MPTSPSSNNNEERKRRADASLQGLREGLGLPSHSPAEQRQFAPTPDDEIPTSPSIEDIAGMEQRRAHVTEIPKRFQNKRYAQSDLLARVIVSQAYKETPGGDTPINHNDPNESPTDGWWWSGSITELFRSYAGKGQYTPVMEPLTKWVPEFMVKAPGGTPTRFQIRRRSLWYFDSGEEIEFLHERQPEKARVDLLHLTRYDRVEAEIREVRQMVLDAQLPQVRQILQRLDQRLMEVEAQLRPKPRVVTAADLTAPLPEETEEDDVAYYPTDKEQ